MSQKDILSHTKDSSIQTKYAGPRSADMVGADAEMKLARARMGYFKPKNKST